jgi:hypothetical protein
MWNINASLDASLVDSLPGKNFTVQNSDGGITRVEKYGCGADLRRTSEGKYRMTGLPTLMVGGQMAELWDAGYQKFLLTKDGRKFPAHKQRLLDLRKFNEELRAALKIPTYYNEALGSTCGVTVYDRVKGRKGDDPDETVGAHEADDH